MACKPIAQLDAEREKKIMPEEQNVCHQYIADASKMYIKTPLSAND